MWKKIVHEAASNSEKVLCIANYNSPKQLVISGDREAVEMAVEIAKQRRLGLLSFQSLVLSTLY